MCNYNIILGQLLVPVSRSRFGKIVEETKSDRHCQKFRTWDQFISMTFAQLAGVHGLRGIENTFEQNASCLYHLGLKQEPRRSTIAYANEHRDCKVYELLYYDLYGMLNSGAQKKAEKVLVAIDATTISLNKQRFEWAKFRSSKSGVKLHVKLNLSTMAPSKMFATNARRHENSTLGEMEIDSSEIAIFDRGYNNYAQFGKFASDGIAFVTRMKKNAKHEIISEREVSGDIIFDRTIRFTGFYATRKCPQELRVVRSRDPETKKEIEILTDIFEMSAEQIADLYRQRWQIELFFKTIKQNLKIKTFFGYSQNAVMTQIWIAMCVYVLFLLLKQSCNASKCFTHFIDEIATVLFARRDIYDWILHVKRREKPNISASCRSLFEN